MQVITCSPVIITDGFHLDHCKSFCIQNLNRSAMICTGPVWTSDYKALEWHFTKNFLAGTQCEPESLASEYKFMNYYSTFSITHWEVPSGLKRAVQSGRNGSSLLLNARRILALVPSSPVKKRRAKVSLNLRAYMVHVHCSNWAEAIWSSNASPVLLV